MSEIFFGADWDTHIKMDGNINSWYHGSTCNRLLFHSLFKFYTQFLCRLRSIAAHRDHFVRRLSVRLSVSHTFLVVTHSYVSQATYAFFGMLPLCLKYFSEYNAAFKVEISRKSKAFLRVIERKTCKCEIFYKRWVLMFKSACSEWLIGNTFTSYYLSVELEVTL